nr:alpha/beta fold hydrolase [Nocardia beijingensis]
MSVAAPGYRYLPEEHADVVVSFLDRLDLSQATLVAHDWGGPIGLRAAQQRARRSTARQTSLGIREIRRRWQVCPATRRGRRGAP